jgi:long-subunit fatty acid transport protein
LCKEDIDLECPQSIEQLIAQANTLPGCSIHCSIEFKPWSQWQRLNQSKYPCLSARIQKEREDSEALLKQFIRVADVCFDNGGELQL